MLSNDSDSEIDKPKFTRQASSDSDNDLFKGAAKEEKPKGRRQKPLEPAKIVEAKTIKRSNSGTKEKPSKTASVTKKQKKDIDGEFEEDDSKRFSVVKLPPPQLADGYYRFDKGVYPGLYVHVGLKGMGSEAVPGITIERLLYEKDASGGFLVNNAQKAKVKERGWPSLTLARDEAVNMIAATTFVLKQTGVSMATIRSAIEQFAKKHQTD